MSARDVARSVLAVLTAVANETEDDGENDLEELIKMMFGDDPDELRTLMIAMGSFTIGLIESMDVDPMDVIQSFAMRVDDIVEEE